MRNFTNKKFALLSLTSLLLVSFCLLPCGGSTAMAAKSGHAHNKSHKEMGNMDHAAGGKMEAHNCRGGSNGALKITDETDTASCQHCTISVPAILKDTKVFSHITFDLPRNEGLNNILLSSTGGLLNLYLPPPRHKSPIYIINSIYII